MKRTILLFSALAAVLAALIAVPWTITAMSSDDGGGGKATGPAWQSGGLGGGSPQRPPRVAARDDSRNPERAPSAETAAQAVRERNAEMEKLSRMYAEQGMTPELMQRIARLRAAQAGKTGAPPQMTPEMMQRLSKLRAAMQGQGATAPTGTKMPAADPSSMDPRFARLVGRLTVAGGSRLSPDAVMSIRLVDVTRIDRPRVIAEQNVMDPGPMPASFQVWYSRGSVHPKGRYAVQALVADGGEVRWKTTADCSSALRGKPAAVEIALQPFKQPRPPAPEVLVGDSVVLFDGRKPLLADGAWMLPAAPVLKAAGIEPVYSEAEKVLTVAVGEQSLSAKLPGRTVVLKDGIRRDLSTAMTIRDGAVYAPIEFIEMATGRKALFDRESNAFVLVKL